MGLLLNPLVIATVLCVTWTLTAGEVGSTYGLRAAALQVLAVD